jgi:ADP-ribose pyrophosphatase YjhB (NUDIX family)
MVSFRKLLNECGVVVRGAFSSEMIHVDLKDDHLTFTKDEHENMEIEWRKAEQNRTRLYDGPLVHLHGLREQEGQLYFTLLRTTCKEYVGTGGHDFKGSVSGRIHPVSVGTVLLTSDAKLIHGRRKNVEFEGLIGVPAGLVNPDADGRNRSLDFFTALRRELCEEVGIREYDIRQTLCLGVIAKEQPYLAFVTEISLSYVELAKLRPMEVEFQRFDATPANSLSVALLVSRCRENMATYALANILVYGGWSFGEKWLDSEVLTTCDLKTRD